MNSENKNIYSVTRLNRAAKSLLEDGLGVIWLSAEISNLTIAVSGHWYFTLKDHSAQVKCAMFKGNNRRTLFTPKHGQQVLVRGKLSLYETRGDYQLIIESMQAEGDGALKQQFEALKCQLAGEGLFSAEHKKPLPQIIKRVGIVTSSTGAALFDILSVLKRRDPRLEVIIYPSLVQGKSSAASIVAQINLANARHECDLLIVGRGGGSLEDLYCFNDINVAYAIFHSQLPIISAVGHEIDVTISDFVADIRAATPSAAAELVSQNKTFVSTQLSTLTTRLQRAIHSYMQHNSHLHALLKEKLRQQDPQHKLQQKTLMTDELSLRLSHAMQQMLHRAVQKNASLNAHLQQNSPQKNIEIEKQKQIQLYTRLKNSLLNTLQQKQMYLQTKMARLNAVSPLATLARGYAIVKDAQGKVVTDATSLKEESKLNIHFAKGEVQARIIK
ncbi:exodeoxyribonuclease VII large subunit [Psychromonas sp. CNPT3]|uniref:exodeoxyribonuclease VII large subunit n=1 Tax=Psychromonas sp. CNPT3 TaxID=314282 RepID=UPI00006E5848|nr:exodeoxyribonuclease VII large subunit [Psychromonas sp. CNPT3]AGH81963.1 exodeoxyribonuclease VII large subunit [Psychromonas sp. CNPT3]